MVESSLLVISRAWSKSPSISADWTLLQTPWFFAVTFVSVT
jgi:hypothetical protein